MDLVDTTYKYVETTNTIKKCGLYGENVSKHRGSFKNIFEPLPCLSSLFLSDVKRTRMNQLDSLFKNNLTQALEYGMKSIRGGRDSLKA